LGAYAKTPFHIKIVLLFSSISRFKYPKRNEKSAKSVFACQHYHGVGRGAMETGEKGLLKGKFNN
jgi:hypothetical protein